MPDKTHQREPFPSLSARRAWIEISCWLPDHSWWLVALRKESVDRNFYYANKDCDWVRSLSARRAWIEIMDDFEPSSTRKVALRKESVDRNRELLHPSCTAKMSLSARRAWIEI